MLIELNSNGRAVHRHHDCPRCKEDFLDQLQTKARTRLRTGKGEPSRALWFLSQQQMMPNSLSIPWSLLENQVREKCIIICKDSRPQATSLRQPKKNVHFYILSPPYLIQEVVGSLRRNANWWLRDIDKIEVASTGRENHAGASTGRGARERV